MRLGAARLQQPRDLVLAELVTHELERRRVPGDEERDGGRLAWGPGVVACEPARVRCASDERRDLRIAPAVELGDMLGVDGETRRQLEAA